MQPAISIGTILQNHYRIIQLLGQGGFGRTYLAEDQGRFNERCAIKEFVPTQGEDRFSDKATELFKREASVLYQISHPQVPQFRATFEEAERLFLVQDYVEGPTYHEVLNQRRSEGKTFSEAEIRQFLKQILPVLAHIHAKGIIHRDISPDNIILRQKDRLPVLIDFGVVKEVVTKLHLDGTSATTVGKAGYAPSEQIQTGRAYPSSDLYALAVTSIVLLTGKEPQTLFDDHDFTWTWQDHAVVTPALATVLNKALSFRPGDRFQSVKQMAQALGSEGQAANQPPFSAAQTPAQTPPLSQMQTVAVGRANPAGGPAATGAGAAGNSPTANQTRTQPQRDTRMVMPSEREPRRSFLENPFAVGTLAAGLAAVAGFGGWAVVQSLDEQPEAPAVVSPEPTFETPREEPEPIESKPEPVEYEQPELALVPGVTKQVEGNMRGGDKVNYPLFAEAGQPLSVELEEEGVLLSLLGPDGNPVEQAERVRRWEGTLIETGEYRIQLSPVQGVQSSDYRLSVTIGELPTPEPLPEDTDEPADGPLDPDNPAEERPDSGEPQTPPGNEPPLQPDIQSQRVSFPSGAQSMLVANNVSPGQVRRYVINAQEGEILTVEVVDGQGQVAFDLLLPTGDLVPDAAELERWEGFLQLGGDYMIDVYANDFSEFTLSIGAAPSP